MDRAFGLKRPFPAPPRPPSPETSPGGHGRALCPPPSPGPGSQLRGHCVPFLSGPARPADPPQTPLPSSPRPWVPFLPHSDPFCPVGHLPFSLTHPTQSWLRPAQDAGGRSAFPVLVLDLEKGVSRRQGHPEPDLPEDETAITAPLTAPPRSDSGACRDRTGRRPTARRTARSRGVTAGRCTWQDPRLRAGPTGGGSAPS